MGGSTDNPSCIPTQQHHYPHLSSPSSSVPFSSYYTSSTGERRSGGDEDWGSGSRGFRAVASPGLDPAGSFRPKEMPPELEFDAHGSESEDGVGLLEETAKPSSLLRGSGSKRSRAAEVHNMSEKRRRSRINEKMKALQNLIPNSNKTDKASMLDEAIEYLKHLQLQVQMLSMRNGLNLHPLYMHGALSPQLNMGFAVDNGSATNIDVGVPPPLHLDLSARNSYGLSDTASHPPIIQPCVTRMTAPGTSFGMEPSHSHHGPFQLPVSDEIFTEDIVPAGRLDSGRSTRNLQENEMKSMAVAAAAALHVEGGVLGRERPEDNKLFIQHLHGLRVGSSFASEDVKPRSPEF